MKYVIDTCFFRQLISNYKRVVFPEIWVNLENLIKNKVVSSVDQTYKELELQLGDKDKSWPWFKARKNFFYIPCNVEAEIVKQIFSFNKFQESVSEKNIRNGAPVADPFIIARALHIKGKVVTAENYKENSARIPNICEKFGLDCIGRDQFLAILRDINNESDS